MSARIRDENNVHITSSRKPTINKKIINENTLKSITRPTVASSLKVSSKQGDIKSKGSRTVLTPLNKPNQSKNTPKPRATLSEKDRGKGVGVGVGVIKSKPLASKTTTQIQSQNQNGNNSSFQTPRPTKKIIPKSSKKAINVYTPARPKGEEVEVECAYPKPPGLEDGPPSPIRNTFLSPVEDFDLRPGLDSDIPSEEFGLIGITELPSGNLEEP